MLRQLIWDRIIKLMGVKGTGIPVVLPPLEGGHQGLEQGFPALVSCWRSIRVNSHTFPWLHLRLRSHPDTGPGAQAAFESSGDGVQPA